MFFLPKRSRRQSSSASSNAPQAGNRAFSEPDKQVREEALELARLLVAEFGAKEVYLVGSHRDLDIHLAVTGLDPLDYWQASVRLANKTRLTVELTDLTAALPSMVRKVRREGMLLVTGE